MYEIKTQNLILRDFNAADINTYHAFRSAPKFQRFYSDEDASKEFSSKLLNLFIRQSQEIPRTCFQLAITLSSGVLVGSVGVRMESSDIASIGCELDPRYQGKRIALEAGRAMLLLAFEKLHLQSVYADTNSENLAAIRLCKMLGLELTCERVGDKEFKGREWSTSVFSISSDKWYELQKDKSKVLDGF